MDEEKSKRENTRKAVERLKMFTFSLPDDVAAELDKQERGKKSKIVAEALREYFGKTAVTGEKEEVVSGMTEEQIVKRIKEHLGSELLRKDEELKVKIEEARKRGDYATAGSLADTRLNYLWVGKFTQEITMKEIEAALGLPYMKIWNKILPILRRAGYRVVDEKVI